MQLPIKVGESDGGEDMCFAKWNQGVFPREIEAWASEGSLRWIRMVYNDGTQVTAGKKPAADTAVLQIKASQGDSARRQVQPYLARTERTSVRVSNPPSIVWVKTGADSFSSAVVVRWRLLKRRTSCSTTATKNLSTWPSTCSSQSRPAPKSPGPKRRDVKKAAKSGAKIGAEYSWEAGIPEVAVAQNKKKIEVTAK